MSNKNKTVSFRVSEGTFEELRDVAEERDLSLSSVFRDYVDTFVAHEGQVEVVPKDGLEDPEADFPPRVEVPKEFVREHERLELENEYLELELEHLRQQLEEHKEYIAELKERLESDEDVIYLEDLDDEEEETFRIG
jgi:hypothetical protein